ncbi:MAG TPA: F0F1 ATP synthase subunit B [Succinivibrionaceae bacterium]|nr:F0F1 ATP synthase subunit B [Succinivibrio sp.]HAR79530.1 F0F1 ATP synthase subunit B [Succinivibrionaceae bacterium]
MEINATFVGQAVAFLIFAAICMKFVWPPLMNALEKRQKEIADGLSAAEKAKKSLELAKSGAADTLREAKLEAQKIIDEANKQRSAIIDKATEEANLEKRKILDHAKVEIEAERNKAKEELRAEVISLAVSGAEKILDKKVDSESDRVMLKKLMDTL